jgi:hypothetical protein
MLLQANLTWYMSTICSPFSNQFITSKFLFNTVFCQFFIWIALGDVELCFLCILVTKTNAFEAGTRSVV